MRYNVVKNGEVVKKNLSKKQAEDYCEKMNEKFMNSQEKVQKEKVKSGLPLKKGKYELYKVEVVKENVIRLTESDLTRIVKRVIKEYSNEEDVNLSNKNDDLQYVVKTLLDLNFIDKDTINIQEDFFEVYSIVGEDFEYFNDGEGHLIFEVERQGDLINVYFYGEDYGEDQDDNEVYNYIFDNWYEPLMKKKIDILPIDVD